MKLWVKGKVEIMSEYDDHIFDCWGSAMNAPAVVRMKYFVKLSKKEMRTIPLTRRNIWERDNGKCQYCGDEISLSQLTFDHVKPRVQNGGTSWHNVVASCSPCNTRKGGRTPEQAGMRLLKKPDVPSTATSVEQGLLNKIKMTVGTKPPKSWQDFIYWNIELND